ncbi:hypothetical protein [Paenibacillus sp. MMS18-CY102]|uniref:hypothetical protein n=1 Tax=Paenibacillus sp. MMS18-CY102 TaxID=2682849 RepID=UPI0013663278|nr:hypothetical protein [Paenibacillus sp. MMS18-CY102]MWC29308.1 hypothetical protein [Paenibacillus sp. MMS18-CY102]
MNLKMPSVLQSFVKLLTPKKWPTSKRPQLVMDTNQIDEFIFRSCEEIGSILKTESMLELDAKTVVARFPVEEKSKIISILQSTPLTQKEVVEVAEIIHMTYLALNDKAINDCTDFIQEHIKSRNLKGTDHEYIFCYDETRNDRKFWIKDGRFNIDQLDSTRTHKDQYLNFVVGGFLYDEKVFDGNCDSLLTRS